jgi:hypothetical protein
LFVVLRQRYKLVKHVWHENEATIQRNNETTKQRNNETTKRRDKQKMTYEGRIAKRKENALDE